MRKIVMTGTDLQVSQLALGTAQFGAFCPKDISYMQLDAFVDRGGNLLDTAHAYGNWGPFSGSPSETTIGEWLKKTGKRNQVIISTKGGHPDGDDQTIMRVTRSELEADLESSLSKLGLDCVDMYFLHRDDPAQPVEELLGWLEEKVKEGKIRYYGCSNWGLARMKEAQEKAKEMGAQGFACNQIMGCLADVHPETLPPSNVVMDASIRAYHKETQLTFMAYMSLARGYLLQRLAGAEINPEDRANYTCPSNDRIVEKLREISGEEYGAVDFCYQYLVQQEFPTIPIAGFKSVEQMEQAIRAIDLDMPKELLEQVSSLKELQK